MHCLCFGLFSALVGVLYWFLWCRGVVVDPACVLLLEVVGWCFLFFQQPTLCQALQLHLAVRRAGRSLRSSLAEQNSSGRSCLGRQQQLGCKKGGEGSCLGKAAAAEG